MASSLRPTHRIVTGVVLTVVALVMLQTFLPGTSSAQTGDQTTTSLIESDGQSPAGNIVPRPNSGQAPDSPNDPGGWQQYMVFGLIFAGLALIVVLAVRESRKARAGKARSSA